MSLREQYATNKNLEVQGVELPYGNHDNGDAMSFTVARMGGSNKAYSNAVEKAIKPYRRQIDLKTMDENIAQKIMREVFADTVLKGWKNVLKSDVTGDPKDEGYADFTRANAIALLTSLPELYSELQDFAKQHATFREEALEEEAKN